MDSFMTPTNKFSQKQETFQFETRSSPFKLNIFHSQKQKLKQEISKKNIPQFVTDFRSRQAFSEFVTFQGSVPLKRKSKISPKKKSIYESMLCLRNASSQSCCS
mmetsp:Transcript_41716/g.48176  ORF Transcript_41716/g.48176 Transcript_41716/m.48176 type:complete len:104 (-) Transcript_41716:2-313(-)